MLKDQTEKEEGGSTPATRKDEPVSTSRRNRHLLLKEKGKKGNGRSRIKETEDGQQYRAWGNIMYKSPSYARARGNVPCDIIKKGEDRKEGYRAKSKEDQKASAQRSSPVTGKESRLQVPSGKKEGKTIIGKTL